MFEITELAILHKAVSEMNIKGADAPAISKLLQKLVDAHSNVQTKPTTKKSGK